MRNLARLIQRWLNNFREGAQTASGSAPDIIKTFARDKEESKTKASAVFTLFVALFATLTAFAGPAAPIAASLSGLSIAGSGATQWIPESTKDPRFDTLGDLQQAVVDVQESVDGAITEYFKQLFVNVPPKGDWDRGTMLARAVESGAFADQDYITKEGNGTASDMTRLIQAAMISETWHASRMVVVKWSYDGEMAKNWNPCGSGDKTIFMKERTKEGVDKGNADHIVACPFDRNNVIVS